MTQNRHPPDSALVLAKQAQGTIYLFLQIRKTEGKLLLKRYLVLLFFGWLGRGVFGFASRS